MRFPLVLYADGGRDGGDWRVVYQFGMVALLLVVMHLSLFYCVYHVHSTERAERVLGRMPGRES